MAKEFLFEVLYSPQLIQKRKKWYEGSVRYYDSNRKIILKDPSGLLVGECFWSRDSPPQESATIEVDRFLVELLELQKVIDREANNAKKRVNLAQKRSSGSSGDDTELISKKTRGIGSSSGDMPLSEVLESNNYQWLNKFPRVGDATPTWRRHSIDSSDNSRSDTMVPRHNENYAEDRDEGKDMMECPHIYDNVESGSEDTDFLSDDCYSSTNDGEADITDVKPVTEKRWSPLENVPADCPQQGPWTLEAYLLFAWNPQKKVKVKEEPV